MPKFTLHGAEELSCADSAGRAYTFIFPYETESPEIIALLLSLGAREVKSSKIPAPEPLRIEEKKKGGDV